MSVLLRVDRSRQVDPQSSVLEYHEQYRLLRLL
jgi:hypothetical protein